jgi:hypothetical protein
VSLCTTVCPTNPASFPPTVQSTNVVTVFSAVDTAVRLPFQDAIVCTHDTAFDQTITLSLESTHYPTIVSTDATTNATTHTVPQWSTNATAVVSAIAGTHWSTQSSPFLLSYSSPHQSTDRVPRGSHSAAVTTTVSSAEQSTNRATNPRSIEATDGATVRSAQWLSHIAAIDTAFPNAIRTAIGVPNRGTYYATVHAAHSPTQSPALVAALESPFHRSLDTAIEPTVHRPIVAAVYVPIVLSHLAAVYSPKWPA